MKPGGFKRYGSWVKLDSTCTAPHLGQRVGGLGGLGVALQVAFERQILKQVFSLDRL